MFIDVYSNPESNRKGVLHYFSRTITDLNNKKGSQATNTEISSATMCKEGDFNNQANMDDLIKKHG